MRLFTKEIDKKLFEQYKYGADLDKQMVVAKIFNPYSNGVWYLLNSDPEDPDYIWAIVDLFEPEMGSVSRSEFQTIKVPPFGLGLERDIYFTPKPAKEVWEGVSRGERFAKGGNVKFYDQNDEWRLSRPSGSIEKDILQKVQHTEEDYVGNFGWKTSSGKMADGYLYKLNDYDQNLVKDIKLKEGEKIYRYFNRTSAIGGMKPLIKINIDKELLYFLVDNDNDDIIFETRGIQALWIALIKHKYAHGGMTAGRWYKDNSGKEFRYIGESQGKMLFNDGEKIVTKDEEEFEERPKERKLFGIFEEGGELNVGDEGMFEGGEAKITKITDTKYEYSYLDEDGKESGMRLLADKNKFENQFRIFPKMAHGGMMEHGLRIGDKVTTDMFWDNQIVVENLKTHKRAQIDLETGKRIDEYARGGEVVPYIVWVSKDGNKRELLGEFKSMRAADMKMKKLWESGEYNSMGMKKKDFTLWVAK
jgi:hypothetical protein